MEKIYYRQYRKRIYRGEITIDQAIELVRTEVPANWRDAVIALLEADREVTKL